MITLTHFIKHTKQKFIRKYGKAPDKLFLTYNQFIELKKLMDKKGITLTGDEHGFATYDGMKINIEPPNHWRN